MIFRVFVNRWKKDQTQRILTEFLLEAKLWEAELSKWLSKWKASRWVPLVQPPSLASSASIWLVSDASKVPIALSYSFKELA